MCSPRKIFLSVWRLLWLMFLLELFIQSSQLQIRFISIIVSSILAGSSKCTSRCVDEKYNQSVNTFKSSCLCVYIPYMPDCSLYNIIIIKMSCNKQKGTFQIWLIDWLWFHANLTISQPSYDDQLIETCLVVSGRVSLMAPSDPTLFPTSGKRFLSCQGSRDPWHGTPSNISSDGHKSQKHTNK